MQFIANHCDEVGAHIKKCELCAYKYRETLKRHVESLPEKKRVRLWAMARALVKALITED
jgi:hypothetical protein